MSGTVFLHFFGQPRRIDGGSFDRFQRPAIGVCLEMNSSRVAQADVQIPIADFQAPTQTQLRNGLLAILKLMRTRPSDAIYIGCRAGLGRTGTLIAALAKLALVDDPVAWTRLMYHPHAVETAAQEAAVAVLDVDAVWTALDGDERQ